MSQWFTGTYLCSCGNRFEVLVRRDERHGPQTCDVCGGTAHETVGAPAIMGTALPDGTDRGAAWGRQKDIARLKMERRNAKPGKRADVDKEIKKLQTKQLENK